LFFRWSSRVDSDVGQTCKMSKYESITEYANHIRRETSGIISRLCAKFGPEHAVTVTVAELCEAAADIVQQSRMQAEQAGAMT